MFHAGKIVGFPMFLHVSGTVRIVVDLTIRYTQHLAHDVELEDYTRWDVVKQYTVCRLNS